MACDWQISFVISIFIFRLLFIWYSFIFLNLCGNSRSRFRDFGIYAEKSICNDLINYCRHFLWKSIAKLPRMLSFRSSLISIQYWQNARIALIGWITHWNRWNASYQFWPLLNGNMSPFEWLQQMSRYWLPAWASWWFYNWLYKLQISSLWKKCKAEQRRRANNVVMRFSTKMTISN